MERMSWRAGLAVLAGGCVLFALPALAQDNVEGPWGTVHGDIYGASRMYPPVPLQFGTGTDAQVAWDLDVQALGLDRVGGWGSIVFDADGNLYWKSTAGNHKLGSVDPDGNLRWIAQDDVGGDFEFGSGWSSAAPVVGEQRVYALGVNDYAGTGEGVVAAFDKSDGSLIWKTQLAGAALWTVNNQATPVLYDGKLYVVGTDSMILSIIQLDAATGAIDWEDQFMIFGGVGPQVAFVPDIFNPGEHGLYFPIKDAVEGDNFAYGFKITSTGATQEWSNTTGKLAHTHMIYNPLAPASGGMGRLYAPTWTDYGDATMWAYDPVTGDVFNNEGDWPAGGHGWYDVGAVDWDDLTIVAGGFDGKFGMYVDNGDSTFTVDPVLYEPWFGEPRVLGQLVTDCAGNSIVITGTNSRSDLGAAHDARVIAVNLTQDVRGYFDDSALLIDDVKVWDGGISFGTLIMDENFDAYTADSPLAGQGGWEHDNQPPSGDDVENPAMVIAHPLEVGNVAMFDAAGAEGGWVGAFHDLPDTTAGTAVMQWKQLRVADFRDNFWFAFGDFPNDFNDANGWGMGWDINGKMTPWKFYGLGDGDPESLYQTAGVWQTVTITYDFSSFTATIDIDGTTGDPVPPEEFGALFITGIIFQLEGTAITDQYNEAMLEYGTGVITDHGFTIRGGPLLGPDGKIYYFDDNTRHLVALEPVTIKGDCNCDGHVDGFDIDAFVLAITNPAGWEAMYPCDYLGANDVNNDSLVNGFDIDGFVALLTGC